MVVASQLFVIQIEICNDKIACLLMDIIKRDLTFLRYRKIDNSYRSIINKLYMTDALSLLSFNITAIN
jgi:hypothetical protein